MANRSLEQIMAESNPLFDPSRSLIQQQMAALPGQFEADQKGLEAQAARANENILTGARRRGLGFSGIPLGEQAQYNATEYMPAVAKLKGSQIGQQMSLQDALNQLNREHSTYAQGIYQTELDRDQQERQFQQQQEAQRRAAAAAIPKPTLKTDNNAVATQPLDQLAFDDAYTRIRSQTDDEVLADIRQSRIDAGRGNEKANKKLAVYYQYRPDLFRLPQANPSYGAGTLGVGQGLTSLTGNIMRSFR